MARTESIGLRVEPELKAAAEKAAAADHRSVASLLEKLLVEHLRSTGFLPGTEGAPRPRKRRSPFAAIELEGKDL
jgi:hypothetical protein